MTTICFGKRSAVKWSLCDWQKRAETFKNLFFQPPKTPSIYLSIMHWVFGAQFFPPVLVFAPSVLPSSPLVCALGRSQLKLSKRQVEQVQHSNPPSLSLSLQNIPYPARPSERERERGTHRHTQRQRGRKTETQWEATGGEERKMLTFGVFQNETSHLTKHPRRIQCPSTQYWGRRLHNFSFNNYCLISL